MRTEADCCVRAVREPIPYVINWTIIDDSHVVETVIPAPALENCDQNNVCAMNYGAGFAERVTTV
jgi:hypothetical protein